MDATIALAREADRLGFARYWLAEHHAMRGLADPVPEILVARLTAETRRMRIGTGGVLLPHQAAFKVAEQFRMLDALAPGRIDLGIGRAPGGTWRVAQALESRDVRGFPVQVRHLTACLDGATEPVAMPRGETTPEMWLLGSSDYSAALAAELGLPFCFAHFISGDAPEITRRYRRDFRPSSRAAEPRVMLCVSAIAAATPEEAETRAATVDLWRLRIRRGIDLPVPSLADARAFPYTEHDRDEIVHNRRRLILGSATGVLQRLDERVAMHEADEAMILTITPDYESRLESYRLLAEHIAAN